MSADKPEHAQLIYRALHGSDEERRDAIATLEENGARHAVPELLELVAHPDPGVRANVAHALGELGDEQCGPALLALLDDDDALVRLLAAESLGKLRYGASADALTRILVTDHDPLVRVHAAEALECIGDPRSLPALTRALDDADAQVRAHAAVSIGGLGGEASTTVLAARLAREQDTFTQAHLLLGLYRLGSRRPLQRMLELATEADDVLATTILNLAASATRAEDAAQLIASLTEIARKRPTLRHEIAALIERLQRASAAT
jgi:HEAT repeat protein